MAGGYRRSATRRRRRRLKEHKVASAVTLIKHRMPAADGGGGYPRGVVYIVVDVPVDGQKSQRGPTVYCTELQTKTNGIN